MEQPEFFLPVRRTPLKGECRGLVRVLCGFVVFSVWGFTA